MEKQSSLLFPLLLLVLLSVFGVRFLMLQQSEFAPGLDGYYYAGQVYSLTRFGKFRIPESSPVVYGLALLSLPFNDVVLANKVGAALLATFLVWALFLLVRQVSGNSYWGLLAAALAGLSTAMSSLSVEFLKNLGAMACFLMYLGALARWEGEHKPGRVVAAVLWGGLAFLSHRLVGVLVIACTLLWLLLRTPPRLRWRLLAACTAGALVLAGLLMVLRGGQLHPRDVERLAGSFRLGAVLPLFSHYMRQALPLQTVLELSAVLVIPWVLIFFHTALRPPLLRTVWICCLLCCHPFWNFSSLDMGYRVLLSVLPLVIVLVVVVAARHIRIPFRERTRPYLAAGVGALLLVAVWLLPGQAYRVERDPPYGFYKKLIQKIRLPKQSLLICHGGLNLFYTYSTWKDGLNYLPEYHVPTDKLWRLSHGVPFHEYQRVITEDVEQDRVRRLSYPYHLIREDAWRRYLKRIPRALASTCSNWYNPHRKRPAFLQVHQPGN